MRDDGLDEQDDVADAVAVCMAAPMADAGPGAPLTLEVNHIWGNSVLGSRVFARDEEVRLGVATADRWTFLGVDMGFVPRPVAVALGAIPLWADLDRTWRDDFVVPAEHLPEEVSHRLVTVEDGAQILNLAPDFGATFRLGHEALALADLAARGLAHLSSDGAARVPLVAGLRFAVNVGDAVLVGGLAPRQRRIGVAGMDRDDLPVLALAAAGAAMVALVAGLLTLAGPPVRTVASAGLDEELVVMLLDVPPPAPATPTEGAAAAKREEGRRGPAEKVQKPDPGDRPGKKRTLDRQVAEHAGVLGAFAGGAFDEVLGDAGLSEGLVTGTGALIGAAGTGFDGLGRRGGGLGGGGEAEGLGTFEVGRGVRGGGGPPRTTKQEGQGIASTGEPILIGTLQASEIDEVVKRHLSEIRYCYQRELQKSPGLAGKVVVKFTIASDGTVSSASPKASTLSHPTVESCLVGRFQRMKFPEPRGGGLVMVSYPLMFAGG